MTPEEAATLLCEDCEINAQRHNDPVWGHLCDPCFEAFCDPDFYYLDSVGADWTVEDMNAWCTSGLAYRHLDPNEQWRWNQPYSWEVGYA